MTGSISEDDIDRLAANVGEACLRRDTQIVTAESCTGGGVAEAITRIAGSSAWFDRGFVTYSNEAKEALIGVSHDTLLAHGAVSEEVVREMASGALRHSQARASVAVTGIAGPGGATPGKPVGLVWFAWADRDAEIQSRSFQFPGDRLQVRRQSVAVALQGLVDLLTPANARYGLQVGQFESADAAQGLAARVQAAGLPSAMLRLVDRGGRWWTVVAAGTFNSVEDARAARGLVARQLGISEAFPVITLPPPYPRA